MNGNRANLRASRTTEKTGENFLSLSVGKGPTITLAGCASRGRGRQTPIPKHRPATFQEFSTPHPHDTGSFPAFGLFGPNACTIQKADALIETPYGASEAFSRFLGYFYLHITWIAKPTPTPYLGMEKENSLQKWG